MYVPTLFDSPASDGDPFVVILNDSRLSVKVTCDLANFLGYKVVGFYDEDEAFDFLVKNGQNVCSVWTDTFHPESQTVQALLKLNRIALPEGVFSHLTFLYGAIDPYAAEARVVFCGGFAGGQAIDHEIATVDSRVSILPVPVGREQIKEHLDPAVALWRQSQIDGHISAEVATVNAVADELTVVCGKVPELLDRLTSRQFEEMVGAIFKNCGFTVELTSQTKDGGYDLLVVSNSKLEQEIAIVEVKHYRPDRPVGVAVVRALYGVRSLRSIPRCYLVTSSSVSVMPSANLPASCHGNWSSSSETTSCSGVRGITRLF
jgi:Restriction endonuclease